MSMTIKVAPVGSLQANCYFLIDEATKKAAIVDPGGDADYLVRVAGQLGIDVTHILLTHGHFDHIDGFEAVRDQLGAKAYIHEGEKEYLTNASLSLVEAFTGAEKTYTVDGYLQDDTVITIGESLLKTIKVPGHTLASVCFYNEKDGFVVVGDTLFAGGMGRTDFYPGSPMDLAKNIKEKLLTLPDEVKVYPGHESSSTIGNEKRNNPYFR